MCRPTSECLCQTWYEMPTRSARTPVFDEVAERRTSLADASRRFRSANVLTGRIEPWFVPPVVELTDGCLRYEWSVEEDGEFSVDKLAPDADRSLLREFYALATTDDRQIRRFALKWGPLGLDRAGLLQTGHVRSEPVADWRLWSTRARAICRAAGTIKRNGEITGFDRAVLADMDPRVTWYGGTQEADHGE